MKKLLALLGTLLWMGSVSFAQTTTVSGTVVDSDGTTWTNGTISIQFVPNSSQPNINIYNINGVPLSAAVMTQGPLPLDPSGAFSRVVYTNSSITPSGSTWQYTICPRASSRCGVFTIQATGSTQNLTSVIPASIPAPRFLAVAGAYGYADIEAQTQNTVGATYWNVNSNIQLYWNGAVFQSTAINCSTGCTLTGPLNGPVIESVYFADQFAGADIGAKANAAYTAASLIYALPTIHIPAGSYTYSTTMSFGGPVKLQCEPGTILNFTGSGNAITMGPSGLVFATYNPQPYTVDGCQFTGGASANAGIFFQEFVTQSFVYNTTFFNFGRSAAWNIWYQGENWDARIDRVYMWGSAGTSQAFNGVYTNAADPANGTSGDQGQTQLSITNSHIQNIGSGGGVGIYLNGYSAKVSNSNIAMIGGPNIQVGAYAGNTEITDVYMERPTASTSLPCIQFGDPIGSVRVATAIVNLSIKDTYCNVHNVDETTTSNYLAPATAQSTLQGAKLTRPIVNALTPGNPLVVLNNLAGQTGNVANDIAGATILRASGSNLSPWGGDSGSAGSGDVWTLPAIKGVNLIYGAVQASDGSLSTITVTASGGTNYIESSNLANNGNAPLVISGYSANPLTLLTINSTQTNISGSVKVTGNIDETDGTSAQIRLTSTGSQNYIQSGTNGMGANATLNVTGPSAGQLATVIVNSAATQFTGSITPASGRRGTFVCTGAGTITITNSNAAAASMITISMNTAGGTITTPPAMKTPGNGTNFTVLCGATDTSTYNYWIWN